MDTYRLWVGRKVQIWQRDGKKLIGIAVYKGSEKLYGHKDWIKTFKMLTGKFKNAKITELECKWNPLTIGDKETTGLS